MLAVYLTHAMEMAEMVDIPICIMCGLKLTAYSSA